MIAIPMFLACASGPPPLEEWHAEIIRHSQIAQDPDFNRPMRAEGIGQVLVLSTKWGRLPIITDTEQYVNLLVALPPELERGASFSAADQAGYLRSGGMRVAYESRRLEGDIRILDITTEGAVLGLDVVAREPVIDLDHQGERRIQGEVTARFRGAANEGSGDR